MDLTTISRWKCLSLKFVMIVYIARSSLMYTSRCTSHTFKGWLDSTVLAKQPQELTNLSRAMMPGTSAKPRLQPRCRATATRDGEYNRLATTPTSNTHSYSLSMALTSVFLPTPLPTPKKLKPAVLLKYRWILLQTKHNVINESSKNNQWLITKGQRYLYSGKPWKTTLAR